MSNYRVRQVLALGPMPDRQLRFLVALATWMTDDSRVVRVGLTTLIKDSGNVETTVKKARRELESARKISSKPGRGAGNLTEWTAWCLPEKGGSEVDPFPGARDQEKGGNSLAPFTSVDNPEKGGNCDSKKGVTGNEKRGYPERADLQKPDRELNHRAKTSLSPRELLAAQVPDVSERETDLVLNELKQNGARSVLAVLRAELELGRGPALVEEIRRKTAEAPTDSAGAASPLRSPLQVFCGHCDHGWTEDADGKAQHCPTCHPQHRSPGKRSLATAAPGRSGATFA